MILQVLDGSGVAQSVIVNAQEVVTDHSSTITTTATAQDVLAANVNRSGCLFVNQSANPMTLNDTGVAVVGGAGNFLIPAGGSWPPAGYPAGTGAISVIGTATDKFLCKEW